MDGRLKEIINLASSTILDSYFSTVSQGKLIQFLTSNCGKKRKKRINNPKGFCFWNFLAIRLETKQHIISVIIFQLYMHQIFVTKH